jgi:hypothetical protein
MGQGAGSRVGTGRFQAMGQLRSTGVKPRRGPPVVVLRRLEKLPGRRVALQVEI